MAKKPILLRKDADRTRIEEYGNGVADGIAANPTDFPDPEPSPSEVKISIKEYTDSIKSERERSIITDEITENLRQTAIGKVNSLISFAVYKANGNENKLLNANIELSKDPEKKEMKKLSVKNSYNTGEAGSYFFRMNSMGGGGLIGVFRKGADGTFSLVDAFDISYFTLTDQPSGDQTYYFRPKQKDKWGPMSDQITVRIP